MAISAKVIGITTTNEEIINETTLQDLEINGGYAANICYTQKSYDEILKEDYNKTVNRAEANKLNHHHSVFGHDYKSLF